MCGILKVINALVHITNKQFNWAKEFKEDAMNWTFLTSLTGHNARNLILRSAGLMLLAALIIAVTGCYETDVEVINASSAVSVYGVPGNYTYSQGGSITISAVPDSNDYRFREVSKENKVSTGYLRLVPLRGDIYIVQARYDNETVYFLAFYQFTSDRRFHPLDVIAEEKKIDQLARQYGVTVDWDTVDFVPYLKGTGGNIFSFLRAHSGLNLTPAK